MDTPAIYTNRLTGAPATHCTRASFNLTDARARREQVARFAGLTPEGCAHVMHATVQAFTRDDLRRTLDAVQGREVSRADT